MMELKPCPFCGGKAYITQTLSQTSRFVVGCFGDCFVELPLLYSTREDAIEAWNRRVTDGTERKAD